MSKMMLKSICILFVCMTAICSCGGDVLPKPKGMLMLNYPAPVYNPAPLDCEYTFEMNDLANLVPPARGKKCWYNLEYQHMRATVYLSYFKINKNLDTLLKDAQNLTQEHVVKADEILQEPFMNPDHKVYGMFYEVVGNAASLSQFYVTDSVDNFLIGSTYFKVRPNYDSLLPAAKYLNNDIKHLIESLRWKNP